MIASMKATDVSGMLSESLMSTALYAQRSRQLSDAGEPRFTLTFSRAL